MKTHRWTQRSQPKTNSNQSGNDADDTPSTSKTAQQISPKKLKNLNKNSVKSKAQRAKDWHEQKGIKIAKRKMERLKKRRQLRHSHQHQPLTPNKVNSKRSRRRERKRCLHFLDNAAKELPTQQVEQPQQQQQPPVKLDTSLEEGELVSADETCAVKEEEEVDNDDDEDDCICIEDTVELITIDDDTPSCSRLISDAVNVVEPPAARDKSPVTACRTPIARLQTTSASAPGSPSYAAVAASAAAANNGPVTSTPCEKSNRSQDDEAPIDPLGFFVDVTGSKMFDTINSEDTFTRFTRNFTTLRQKTTKKRRSERLRKRKHSDTDVIVLDDTTVDVVENLDAVEVEDDKTLVPKTPSRHSPSASKHAKRRSIASNDDSVVFVSETNNNPNALPTFIPLDGGENVPNPVKETRSNPCMPKRYRPINPLFTLSERKQLDKYNDNAYNPHADEVPEHQSPKRMVIVDGSNVAYSHALNKEFSVKGLKICLDYFERMGHEVKAVVPQHRLQRSKSTDPEELERMHGAGKIVFTPCKNLPGMSSSSYDDRFVLQLACELDAAIVSNDNYRDLLHENAAFQKVIKNRVIGYSWCNDMFIVPKDPYGKWGPTLHTILNRS